MKTPWRAFVDGVIDNDEKVTTLKNGYQIKDYRHDGVVVTAPPSGASGLGSSSGRDFELCSWARHFTLAMPLSTQVYKWVLANLMLGVTLRWTSIPSREEYKYS